MDVNMADIRCQFLCPLNNRNIGVTMCMPDIKAESEVRMLHLLIYITQKPPVLIENIFHINFESLFILQEIVKEPTHLIRPALTVIYGRDHS